MRPDIQATDAHPAEQVGRQMQKQQNRLPEMQMQADADECTARQPDCRNLQTNRCTDCSRTSNQIARCIARCIARQANGRAEKLNSKQADLQNRWISRQIDAQPDMQMDMQNRCMDSRRS
jgi:hypothetical protein